MNPDNQHDEHPDLDHNQQSWQQAWQAGDSQTRITVDADLLRKEVQRNQQDFFAQILRRDAIEVSVGLLLLLYWFYIGLTSSPPWTWYLTVPAILWIIGFFVVDRMRHPQKPSKPGEPLLSCVKNSLTQVEHQIWLLRNIFWWYLLPPTISILAFFAHVAWLASENWFDALSHAGNFVMLFVVYYFIYWLNQRAVSSDLEPRRQELLTLLDSIGDYATTEHVAASRANHEASSKQLRRWALTGALCLGALVVTAVASGIFDSSFDAAARSSGPAGDSLAKLLIAQRKEKNLVGLASRVVVDGQVEAVAAHGERKHGSDVSLELGDRWHVGGITKSITATMIARLVESGQMQWSNTLGEIFPQDSIHKDWNPVTVRQLLTHTAGAPQNFSLQVRRKQPALGSECTAARREAVLNILMDQPAHPPGTRYAYSNVGFTIAGAMAEQATGLTWEDLVKREVFEPLQLTESGFGPPQSPDPTATNPGLNQPRGHRNFLHGKVAVSDEVDNTPIMGPSATIHMTLSDLCTYAREHLLGERGEGQLLSAETYKTLHTPERDDYAYGWVLQEPTPDIPHRMVWHNGSNTVWYALVVFIPETDTVVAVTSNDGDFDQAEAAAWEVVRFCTNGFQAVANPTKQPESPMGPTAYAKKSPFAAVRWQKATPEVKLDDEWFRLVSLNDLTAAELVAFSQRSFGNKWQKRFEEDLVELLTRMHHPPGDTVKLIVQSLTSSKTQTLEAVPITEANRRAIKAAALAREQALP